MHRAALFDQTFELPVHRVSGNHRFRYAHEAIGHAKTSSERCWRLSCRRLKLFAVRQSGVLVISWYNLANAIASISFIRSLVSSFANRRWSRPKVDAAVSNIRLAPPNAASVVRRMCNTSRECNDSIRMLMSGISHNCLFCWSELTIRNRNVTCAGEITFACDLTNDWSKKRISILILDLRFG